MSHRGLAAVPLTVRHWAVPYITVGAFNGAVVFCRINHSTELKTKPSVGKKKYVRSKIANTYLLSKYSCWAIIYFSIALWIFWYCTCLSLIVSFTLHRGKGSLTLKESAIYSAEWVTAVLHLLTPPATDYNTAASDNREHLSLWPLSTPSPPSLSSLLPQSHGGTESHERRYSAMCLPGFFFLHGRSFREKKNSRSLTVAVLRRLL